MTPLGSIRDRTGASDVPFHVTIKTPAPRIRGDRLSHFGIENSYFDTIEIVLRNLIFAATECYYTIRRGLLVWVER